ncbi:bifunctional phosphoribosylaminoimidazolecarboxamide formyltransferase/IMP cyclohydrolase [Enterococcus sp. CSURQ0835]|uniref:bifunctional phosphoribosylaminoimidazolecarboxamide formyltransferase/IMP cyclohydrolase n=1 Tax=Enterococcus sp. CSURQ0835 TaxID=2681394 RepID=UPI00135CDCC7|nr:bifunctional phosphoribosylaminoimidazolecarboxamide formyltransferase/IMP cyclohydrolase [Enterococcus sp. CSURQ0835]
MRALLSVSDKTGIVEFAKGLVEAGFELVSTGGTKAALQAAGLAPIAIEEVTGFPEMLDDRVKTLHPKIHGGLLARRDLASHTQALVDHEITPIDLVCVNLYPFKETITQSDVTEEAAIEHIDIGGPSMLRSAAKNFAAVTVVVDPADYPVVLAELKTSASTSLTLRKKLAAKVFRQTAAYDALIADYLTQSVTSEPTEKLTLTYDLKQTLRYGENSHQQAAFYQTALPVAYSLANAQQLHGKELSYNNLKDADAALRIIREFTEPTVVALKHMNPCGIGSGRDIYEAYQFAYEADPVSIFGGIVVANRTLDVKTAEALHHLFLEIVIAPDFEPAAFEILAAKKNLRLLTLDFSQAEQASQAEVVSVLGGVLVQEQDRALETSDTWQVVTKRQPTKAELTALEFAWKTVKHVKSNAIVVANEHQTLGVGAGQMNRVGSVKLALDQAADKMDGAVLASDAFFPMDDSVEYAAQHGIKAIVQPGGSIKDQASIEMADRYGVTMLFTGTRHFRH